MGPEDGFNPEQLANKPKVERITTADLKPVIPENGGSVFVLQRNAKDEENRKLPVESTDFGKLDPGKEGEESEATKTHDQAQAFFDEVFRGLSPEDRRKVDILIVAGNASLRMPDGKNSPHKRSVETAEHVLAGVQASLAKHGAEAHQLLNKTGRPIELTSGKLLDLKMFDDSPEFVKYLVDKYGNTKDLWVAYEEDREKEVREQMGVEGPDDIANRVGSYMATLDNAMKQYHQHHPDRRVIVWAISQYDSISPFLKKHVTKQPMEDYLPVDYRAGVVFNVSKDGPISSSIQGHDYQVAFS